MHYKQSGTLKCIGGKMWEQNHIHHLSMPFHVLAFMYFRENTQIQQRHSLKLFEIWHIPWQKNSNESFNCVCVCVCVCVCSKPFWALRKFRISKLKILAISGLDELLKNMWRSLLNRWHKFTQINEDDFYSAGRISVIHALAVVTLNVCYGTTAVLSTDTFFFLLHFSK